jgi:hypothetical protein
MDFGEVLSKAWKIIWKFKILWLFGIFASCSNGGGGGGGGGGSGAQYSGGDFGYYNNFNQIEPWAVVLIIAAAILLFIIITILVLAVSTIGRAGLIQGTKMADQDEDVQLTFSNVFNSSKPFFWRILGLNLLIMVASFAIMIILVLFILFGTVITLGLGLLCLVPLICVLIPIFWVLTTFVEMANAAVVVDDLNVIDALKRGWEVFRGNLGEMVLMGLVLVIGGFIAGFIIAIPMILIVIPLAMSVMAAVFGNTEGLAIGGLVVSGLCFLAYLPVLIVVGGIIRAYIGAAWTLTYLRLTRGPATTSLPDEPLGPETLPEVVDEPLSEGDVSETMVEAPAGADESDENEKPQDSSENDALPDDF